MSDVNHNRRVSTHFSAKSRILTFTETRAVDVTLIHADWQIRSAWQKHLSLLAHGHAYKWQRRAFICAVRCDKEHRPFFFSKGKRKKKFKAIIYRDISKLRLMPRLPEDKLVVFQRVGAPPHFDSEVTSWAGIGLNDVLDSTISGLDLLEFFLWDSLKDEIYVLSMSMTLSILNYWIRKVIAKLRQPLLYNFWLEVEYQLDVRRAPIGSRTELAQVMVNTLPSFSLRMYAFNCDISIIFLPIKPCNLSLHLLSPYIFDQYTHDPGVDSASNRNGTRSISWG